MVDDAAKINIDIMRVLEICRDIELACGELYNYYAEIFCNHEELAALWLKTAREEGNHARQFVLAINLQRQQVADSARIDGFTAKNMLNMIKTVYDGVRGKKPSMLEALSSAIKLEEKLQGCHMTTAVHFVEESHRQLFAAMMKADKDHIEALRRFHQRLLTA